MSDTSIIDVIENIEALKRGIEIVLEANERLRYDNDNLRLEKAVVKSQLATAKRVFGESFTSGFTGATRPNRPKLTAQDARDIRAARAGGAKQADLARNYGVNPATISRIVNRVYH
ncbi:helix-turn-helix DNA-binding domain protein [Mycobacterium phage Keziacharles14]|nr:helix-turn-helix DNA-binding domain protein [Mycobacterium phage Keziacharles14]